ncbi:MAG: UDP-glucose/GDP-mannose dehydrogenase family protein [Calditrichaeota bacterium]|nr:MAG: UDP-glucose/GDP-mannose dehydrogenase family protein [Calditrichota bacterium]
MDICVIGTGYVGLVSGTCFAESGNNVICVDIDKNKINALNNGEVPIYEIGLAEFIKRNVREDRLHFTTDIASAVKQSQICFIAVGTPENEDGSANLKYVMAVAKSIGEHMNDFKVVVDKSTVPVGTAEKVTAEIKKYTDHDFAVVSNPEFLKEGVAIDDFMKPDRVIIGTKNERAIELMRELYSPFTRSMDRLIVMDEKSAEMTKYAANCFLATKISFINDIANLCEKVGADVNSVRKGIGSDQRIGNKFLFPGVGYGGSCFPKDISALMVTARQNNHQLEILEAVDRVNDKQKLVLTNKIKNYFGEDLKGKTIAVWGLSFKPNTDDIREAPALKLIESLLEAGAIVRAFDPEAMANVKNVFGDKIYFGKNPLDVVENADALAIVTEWNAFRMPNFAKLAKAMNKHVIFDGRNLYQPNHMREFGFEYFSIGRQ